MKQQHVRQTQQKDMPKSHIKTIINGYIISGQYSQQEQAAIFKINSSTNKQEKYQIKFQSQSLNQDIRQHFKNALQLFSYLAQSTKNRLKITSDRFFVIELEKDKQKIFFPYSLTQLSQKKCAQDLMQLNKINDKKEDYGINELKAKSNQIQTQQNILLNKQAYIGNYQSLKQADHSQTEDILEKTTQLFQKSQTNTVDQSQEQKEKVQISIKTDIVFIKLPGQQQTLLQFAINSKLEPLTKLIQQNSLINIQQVILKRFNMTEIPPFNQLRLTALKNLVLEDNRIIKIQNLQTCINLQKLNLDSNKIQKIQNLQYFKSLKFLRLGNNQIDLIQGLQKLTNLETLWLDFNNIAKIQNLQNLKCLKSLNLSFNQIQKIQNLENLRQLWELMISDNQLTYISNLDLNVKLGRLALNSNMIQHITGLKKLLLLQNLHLIGNQISKFDKRQFQQVNWLKMLKELKLNGNGIVLDEQNKGLIQRLRHYGIKVYI